MKINVTGGTLPQQEIDYYTEAALKKYPNRNITAIDFDVDGEYVNATYHSTTSRLSVSGGSRATLLVRLTASTTPSAPRKQTA